ncbi:sigma-54-dependent Fis family transcriptional regulator [Desulfoluna limicola]|uniref:Sigma-54-dependent Fis family transcriptional regulator n=1 Tax=Desulfoluna limicola TaxID=2810562 RepID=A0ABM7PC96_9BACT|nr:sigma-54 dependent transcriptional regulator [Desulfoluna limicola]BCS95277.1 sigma-54-dependent Fis family transcriptional regulator [Desulfoluna limicola]
MSDKPSVLIIDDERISRENLDYVLAKEGYKTRCAESGTLALDILAHETFDIVITDLRMDGHDGFAVLDRVKALSPMTEVIIITGYATVANAVDAMRKGAYSYVAKPFRIDEVRVVLSQALEKQMLKKEVTELKREANLREAPLLIGNSPKMALLKTTIRQIATTDCNVVVLGETGTGKELVARTLHRMSDRAAKRFLAFNCGALDENLLANELFGHEKEAFTGAGGLKKGLLESADGGSLFLDEIADMPMSMQIKLLRVLQERSIMRVGGTHEVSIDARIISAANRDLKQEVEVGTFRQDLFFRLNVITVHVPPLRERKEDIPLLCSHFINRFSTPQGKAITGLSSEALEILTEYSFPGNIRELENIIERAVALTTSAEIQSRDLPKDLRSFDFVRRGDQRGELMTLAENEKEYILWVLRQASDNKTRAAEILGIDRVSLWRKMRRYEIDAI